MARAARIVRPSAGAETSIVRLARRIAMRATAAVLKTVEGTWPNTTAHHVEAAIRGVLNPPATILAFQRIGLQVRRANHRQLSTVLKRLPPWNAKREGEAALREAHAAWVELEARLIGTPGRADAARLDAEPSYLNSVMARMRAKRRTNAEIVEVLEGLRQVAPAEEQAAIARVRARVLGWEAKANEEHQLEAGVKRYTWISRRDGRVRARHRELDGTIQRWSRPPVADTRTGFRAHPGGCKNCRCVAEPIESREVRRIAARKARAEEE